MIPYLPRILDIIVPVFQLDFLYYTCFPVNSKFILEMIRAVYRNMNFAGCISTKYRSVLHKHRFDTMSSRRNRRTQSCHSTTYHCNVKSVFLFAFYCRSILFAHILPVVVTLRPILSRLKSIALTCDGKSPTR